MLILLYTLKKLILLLLLYLYITVVSLLLYDGPDEALLYFVLTTSAWRRGLARRAHNPEVVCSNHTAGIHLIHIGSFRLLYQKQLVNASDVNQATTIHRGGAEAARRAHNS